MTARNIEEIDRDVKQHSKDLYFGNGRPGLTTRVLVLEDAVKSIHFYGRWALVLLGGILITAVIHLVLKQ